MPCYVLSDDKRVLTQRGLAEALGISSGGGRAGVHRIAQFVASKQLKELITNDIRVRIENPIKFQSLTSISNGYEATILIDICDAVIEARKQGLLQKQQSHIAERAEMLIRAFAKTGIIALIDEATGYQEVREKDALKLFLEKFINDEAAKWTKTFSDEFFEMIFKMKGWTWHFASTKKPSVVGHYINDFVYSRIAPAVLNELRVKNPVVKPGYRRYKHPQLITNDFGHPKLKEHIAALVALGKASGFNWNNFKRNVERAFPKFNADGSAAQEIGFPED